MAPTRKQVALRHYEVIDRSNSKFASGQYLLEVLNKEGIPIHESQENAEYWQTCCRWALMRKYCVSGVPPGSFLQEEHRLAFTEEETDAIHKAWEGLLNDNETGGGNEKYRELVEFIETGRSNGRPMQWSVMECKAAARFKLHAHPNLELIYCARGALHEIHLDGEPLTRTFEAVDDNPEHPGEVRGPDLTYVKRNWHFDTTHAGHWLVNEIGSIHRSFTATSGTGCLLLVVWGGSHADISKEPTGMSVEKAVDDMDKKIGACACQEWEEISETFLPESERSSSSAGGGSGRRRMSGSLRSSRNSTHLERVLQ